MESLQHTIKAYVKKGEKYYVAECLDVSVVTQGSTFDETISNLQEAVSLYLQDEDLKELGFISSPRLLLTMELDAVHA